jgi:hypothetical protein
VKWSIKAAVPLVLGICCCSGTSAEAVLADVDLSTTVLNEMEIASARSSRFNPDDVLGRERTLSTGAVVFSSSVAGIQARLRFEAARDFRKDSWIDTSAEIQELYATFGLLEGVQATVGKSFLSWDVSYASKPVNFFARETDYMDIKDYRRRIVGVPMVALSWIRKAGTLTGVIASDCAEDTDQGQWALRAQGHIGGAEVAALIRGRSGGLVGFGGTLTCVQGQALELHGSLFLNRGSYRRVRHIAAADLFDPGSPAIYTTGTPHNRWVPHLVLGAQYTTESLFNMLVEYIHDGFGLSGSEWDCLLRVADDLSAARTLGAPRAAVEGNLRNMATALRPRLTRRDYLFVRGSRMWGKTEGSVGALIGLADGGVTFSGTVSYQPESTWDVWAEVRRNMGPKRSEFGEVPERMRFTLMLRFLF